MTRSFFQKCGPGRCLRYVAFFLFFTLIATALSETVWAQTSSPLSPWLMMRNRNRGSISNYHEYVKPRQEIERAFQSQQSQLKRAESETKQLQTQLQQATSGNLQAPGATGPSTGARGAASFRNHSHWYSGISFDPTPRDRRKFK